MSEHDVLKKNRNFYIGVGGTVLEGLLSGSLFTLDRREQHLGRVTV